MISSEVFEHFRQLNEKVAEIFLPFKESKESVYNYCPILDSECREVFGSDFQKVDFGASRIVFIFTHEDYVIKYPITSIDDTYNIREYEFYHTMPEELRQYFAECEFLDRDTGALLMRRADVDEDRVASLAFETLSNIHYISSTSESDSDYDTSDMTDEDFLYCCFGDVPEWDELSDWCANNTWDLHAANIGFIKGDPVIVDYAGY